jgi:ribosomal protein S18 acetylase RimI-like enzyme
VLDLRHFSSSALRPLLEEETQIWSRFLAWDYRGSADMILRYVDSKILPGYVAVERGRAEGYCFFVYEGSKGVVGDLYVGQSVAPDRSIEGRLLTHSISTLQQSPGLHRIEAQLLLHDTGVVAQPFLEEGFSQHPRLFMVLPLNRPAVVGSTGVGSAGVGSRTVSLAPDIEVRRWSEQDYHAAATVITASYDGHIDADINDQYRSTSGSLRFLNNIVRFPGCGVFDNAASFVAIHRPTRALIGLILCSRVKEDVGHVTQVCVVPDQRGRHIGEALLSLTSNELRRRNYAALSLTVTEANRGAVELYKRLGYEIRRVFDAFVWEG